jgi:hypothetical protein
MKKGLKKSKLEVFDIKLDDLIESPENPNEMDEQTFDQFVQAVREDGFDEPIHVVPIESGPDAGKWLIFSGHHRKKAAGVLGLDAVPAVIKPGWTQDKVKIELVRRNMGRGAVNPEKFTKLYNELVSRGYDEAMLKLQMGITNSAEFKRLYQNAAKQMTPAQRKKLDDAKETIKSVDDLSATINKIFTDHGSELDCNMLVFNYGKGSKQKVYYVKCDDPLGKMLENLQAEIVNRKLDATDVFKDLVSKVDLGQVRSAPKIKAISRPRNPAA